MMTAYIMATYFYVVGTTGPVGYFLKFCAIVPMVYVVFFSVKEANDILRERYNDPDIGRVAFAFSCLLVFCVFVIWMASLLLALAMTALAPISF